MRSCQNLNVAIFCGVCASEDYTSTEELDDGTEYYVCASSFHPVPRIWEPPARSGIQLGRSGIGDELTIWGKLYESVPEGPDFVPYGEVEDALAEQYPEALHALIREYGHRWRDPDNPSGRYSASVYLAARLGELAREGLLEQKSGPATGPWAYNGTYEWWRRKQ